MTTITTQRETGDAPIHACDDAITADVASRDPDVNMRRLASDLLMLWALCGKPACRRAQACKRDPRSCARRYGTLAPEAARHGMLLTLDAIMNGIEEVELRARAIPEIAALDAWCDQVETAVCGAARPPLTVTDGRV